jgi:hypothetical protein
LTDPERIDWRVAEPRLLAREKQEMAARAPDLLWVEGLPGGSWQGLAPPWPSDEPALDGIEDLLRGRRLLVRVAYTQGFPMAPPDLFPLDPVPDVELRTRHSWHLNGDGSLCLLFSAADWPGTAADLVDKASGWFVEYLALQAGLIDRMSEQGPFAGNHELEKALRRLQSRTSC